MQDIVVMGSNTVDVYVSTDADLIRIQYPHHQRNESQTILGYPLGRKILAEEFRTSIGGSGINAATAFNRCGLQTTYLGCLGDDMYGAQVYEHLSHEGIALRGGTGEKNGFGIILESQAPDRTILSFKGCNNDLTLEDVEVETLDTKWFYSSTVMGDTYETLKELLPALREKGTKTALNTSAYLAEKGMDELRDVLSNTDMLIVNKHEAHLLTDKSDVENQLEILQGIVHDIVAITDGAKGVHVAREDTVLRGEPGDVDLVDTTGAGDAFTAGLLTGVIQDESLETAVLYGLLQSENVVQSENTTEALASLSALQEQARNDSRKIKRL